MGQNVLITEAKSGFRWPMAGQALPGTMIPPQPFNFTPVPVLDPYGTAGIQRSLAPLTGALQAAQLSRAMQDAQQGPTLSGSTITQQRSGGTSGLQGKPYDFMANRLPWHMPTYTGYQPSPIAGINFNQAAPQITTGPVYTDQQSKEKINSLMAQAQSGLQGAMLGSGGVLARMAGAGKGVGGDGAAAAAAQLGKSTLATLTESMRDWAERFAVNNAAHRLASEMGAGQMALDAGGLNLRGLESNLDADKARADAGLGAARQRLDEQALYQQSQQQRDAMELAFRQAQAESAQAFAPRYDSPYSEVTQTTPFTVAATPGAPPPLPAVSAGLPGMPGGPPGNTGGILPTTTLPPTLTGGVGQFTPDWLRSATAYGGSPADLARIMGGAGMTPQQIASLWQSVFPGQDGPI